MSLFKLINILTKIGGLLLLLSTSKLIHAKDATNTGGKFKLSPSDVERLKELMRVRAKNYGETSVTVTDLESQ
ncbi:hypothetical protein Q4561_18105 [Alteromonas sp. 1_MG-2023]|uniref:hypothetical protein n=1 Tax=Alteromonas sp. 1_MG-2023 TaxID=3062669 RepID=UPI0026E225A0|nr:hypothetical protein [Alteromonas sp. 1_MG-2023]MDO6568991.1 hypothetical protein [Alteromonas sp. 1_MG-2023]